MTPESRIKEDVKKYLDSIGAYQFWPVQTGYGDASLDCLACIHGYFFAIETKRPGIIKPTVRQAQCMTRIERAHGHALLINEIGQAEQTIRSILF